MTSTGCKEFVLSHVFENVSNYKEGQKNYSDVKEHFDVSWYVFLKNSLIFLNFYSGSCMLLEEVHVLVFFCIAIKCVRMETGQSTQISN